MFARPRISYLAALAAFTLVPSTAIVSDPATGREPCGEQSLPIIGPGSRVLGSAVISNDSEFLYVDLHANAAQGWSIKKVHMYAGLDPAPMFAGELDLAMFPYLYEDDIKIMHRFRVPLAELLGADYCGLMFNVAVRLLAVGQDLKGNRLQVVAGTASASHEICCSSPTEVGCTLPHSHWREHHSYANEPSQKIDWPSPEDEDTLLCGWSWLSILKTPPRGRVWTILAQQYISARLNMAAGASVPMQVQVALNSASSYLKRHCDVVRDSDRDTATAMAAILENYNSGLIGPGRCD